MQENPYVGILQFDENGGALLENGCYIKLVVNTQYTHTSINDKYQTFFSVYVCGSDGAYIKKLDIYDKITLEGGCANEYSCHSTLGTCDGVLGFELMDGTTGTYAIRFKVYDARVSDFVIKVKYFGITTALFGDDADNATPVNPDDTAIDPDNVSDDYMDDFMNWLIDLLINQYGKDIEFDDSGIIEALNSIYAKLHAILTSVENRLDKVIGKLDGIISRLENVITAIMKINSLELTQDFLLGEGFDTFDELTYKEMVATALEAKFSFVAGLSDLCNNALSSYSKTTESPVIKFKMEGVLLEQKINLKVFDDYIDEMRYIIAAFVYVSFAFNTYRRIPSYINNGGER